jgi:uncharacterized coiled-coil protein SlyX
VVPDDEDGGDAGCQESPWLCRQLDHVTSVLAQQQRRIDEQSAVMEEQGRQIQVLNVKIEQQNSLIVGQNKQIHQLNDEVAELQAKAKKQDSVIQELYGKLLTMNTKMPSEEVDTAVPSSTASRNPSLRSDDSSPLDLVVSQMSAGMSVMKADIQALQTSSQQLVSSASSFVHWGSSTCSADSKLVYSGVVGGTFFTQAGGGTNTLCLTLEPVAGHVIYNSGNYAYLYGAEYETFYDNHHNMDAVCAVCRSSHATTIMIPGTNVCTAGWTKQYDGFIMGERATQDNHASEFICVDSHLEGRFGSQVNQQGRLLYYTLAQCGSLPCLPYNNNAIVTCVVCSM